MDVSPSVLSALAKALAMPESFFYQSAPVYGAAVSEFFHRKRQSVPVGVLTKIHAQIDILRMQIAALLRAVELLAHELGHMVMHRVPEPEMELQATQFAAEFLMPSKEPPEPNHQFHGC